MTRFAMLAVVLVMCASSWAAGCSSSSSSSGSGGSSAQSCKDVDPKAKCTNPQYKCQGNTITLTCTELSCQMDCVQTCKDSGMTYVSCGTQSGSTHDQCLCKK